VETASDADLEKWRVPTSATATSTKEQLMLTAERLFAMHGIDGVSLRQIGVTAGTTNNSAVQYHFGSKDALVQAILMYRLPAISQRRKLLAARVPSGDLRAVVEAHQLPVLEQAEIDDSYYMTFVEHLQRHGIGEHPFEKLPSSFQETQRAYVERVAALLEHLPPHLSVARITQASTICLHASADRERAHHFDAPVVPFALYVSELFDGLVGFLQAPASEATLAALRALDPSIPERRAFP
jgi:AcrR family transcriptional regulator